MSLSLALLCYSLAAAAAARCNDSDDIQLSTTPKEITSPNYPKPYYSHEDCWWRLHTTDADRTVIVVLEDASLEPHYNCDFDRLEIYDGADSGSPSLGRYCQVTQPTTIQSSGPVLFMRFYSDADRESKGFRAKVFQSESQKLVLETSLDLNCTSYGWSLQLDTRSVTKAFPHMDSNNIYLSNCTGEQQGDILVFNSSYSDCNTSVKKMKDSLVMSNHLMAYSLDAQTNLTSGTWWRHDLSCFLPVNETGHLAFLPVDNSSVVVKTTDAVASNQPVIKLFKDSGFTQPINSNPLKVALGTRVYVQVETTLPDNIKLVLDSCDVSGDYKDAKTTSVALIKDRCPANHMTHMIGSIPSLARFYFDVFEPNHHQQKLYVNCDITLCPMMDFSPECQNTCLDANP